MIRSCKAIPIIFRLLCLVVVSVIASCGERHNEAFYDNILHKAERMHATGAQKAARHYLDSAYNANPNSSPHFRMLRYRDLAHWVYLESKQDTNKYFIDSQLAIIKQYKLERLYRKDYVDALNERGYVYVRSHDLNKAFEYFSRSREMAYGLGDTCSYVAHSYALGMVTYQQKRYREAVNFFREASTYNAKCPWDIYAFFKKEEMQLNIGVSYAGLKLYDSAILYYGKALALADSGEILFPGDTCATNFKLVANGVIKGNLAKMFVALGKADTAIGLLKENIAINDKPNWDVRDAMFSRVQLSEIYFNSRRYHEMNAQLDTLQQKLQIVPSNEIRSKTLHLLYLFYREMENNTLSDLYFDRYAALNDSIEIAANDLNKIDYAAQLRDRDNEYRIALLTRNNKIGNLYLGIALLSAVLAVVIIFFVYRNYYRSKKNVVELTSLNKQVNEQKEALETAMSRLREANIAKDRILHIVAHDLRNPVAGIATTAQVMTMEPLSNDLKEMVELILSASDSARALIDEILEYSGVVAQTMTTEKVDINKLVEQSATLLQLKASSKGQEIRFSPSATPAYVLAHKEKMSRVMGNLLANAVKFSPHGKVIDVLLTNSNGQVKIEVRDQGIGIPADSLPHVFDLVAPPKRLGTDGEVSFGLGLSICRQIVTAHNGDIWVESVEGKGSNFHISLPGIVDQSNAN